MGTGRKVLRAAIAIATAAVVVGALPTPALAASKNRVLIDDVSVAEGNAGTQNATFTITYTGKPTAGTVGWSTAAGTATPGADYTTSSGVAALPAGGCKCARVNVPVLGDVLDEPDETFTVNLSNYSAGTIQDGQGLGTILDDDAPPALSVADASTWEGAGSLTFPVTLGIASGKTVTVTYATANGTASSGSDYTATSGTLTFPVGVVARDVTVPLVANSLAEPTETFTLSLSSPTNATIARSSATGTIVDDDTEPAVSIADGSGAEGDDVDLMVSLSAPYEATVTVDYATADATATAGSDYTEASGTITLAAGETSATLPVETLEDPTDEPDETFDVALSAPSNATLADGSATATIVDDDKTVATLTLKVRRTAAKVIAKGIAEPVSDTTKVKVVLQKKQGGWKKVKAVRVTVAALGDRDGDGLTDGRYKAVFQRPASGRYRVIATLPPTASATGTGRFARFKV